MKAAILFWASIVICLVQAQGQDTVQNAPTTALLEQGWRETLAQVAAMERTSLFVDVNVNAGVVEAFYSKPAGKRAMETLARCLDRHWESIDGHQVFSRSSPLGTVRPPRQLEERALALISQFTDGELRRLAEFSLSLAEIDPMAKQTLYDVASMDPGFAFALMDQGDRAVIGVSPLLRAKGKNAQGETIAVEIPLPSGPKRSVVDALPPASDFDSRLEEATEGPLKFGMGELLTLREILDRASTVFRERYRTDGRLMDSQYFINGDWNQEAFDKAVTMIATAEPTSKRPFRTFGEEAHRAEIESHFDKRLSEFWPAELVYPDSTGGEDAPLKLEDFRHGKAVSLVELCRANQELKSWLLRAGLSEDQTLSLSMGLALSISTGGLRRHGHGLGIAGLKSSTTLVVNQTGIAIW